MHKVRGKEITGYPLVMKLKHFHGLLSFSVSSLLEFTLAQPTKTVLALESVQCLGPPSILNLLVWFAFFGIRQSWSQLNKVNRILI